MTIASHFRHFDELQPWNDRQHMLECIAVTAETADVMTFTFRSDRENWFRYLPGQFVTLELPVTPDDPVMRTYTLSSTPSRPFSVAVTVKAQKDSIGTRWMFDHLRPGMQLKAFGPLGDFSFVRHPGEKYLFISAGSGVTPMMSMTRWMADCAPQTDVAFVSCARTPQDLLFRPELECLSAQMPNLSLGFVVEGRNPRDGWHGLRGRIDGSRLSLLAPDFRDRTVFCCGPEPFMRGVRDMLKVCGFDMARYHEESFQPAAAPAAEELAIRAGPGEVDASAVSTVTFTMAGKEAACPPDQTILQTARAAGVRIGAACEGGLCGTCRVMKVSGEVEMNHNGGILDDEIAEGYILACCSRPLGDVQIEA
ncbi:hybrid-cluster NAD(P)-dependent oxidoreductase (plasmid) [Rhizobium sp. TRM96647]|uniref:hybrid-cluster NAD(P)-dependent oxidoreductase n=1 Tax=unclassified Rhizobium TaxID=2613769 RepID=UPI0021E8C9A6|nr:MULTISPECIES: hybrid-cluster NAD(P)-dependent oxidoreductase [unclassified Rhizobium]MCV3735464.1 hybrid-cluster NAD(P)-dependent oxidoreductase [Rhizobium sp. TRM96647]MCV3757773.1 hybrid-cluster NAD(P)-dependent oxidoreductase [Rhizobium sp. TRM96650]